MPEELKPRTPPGDSVVRFGSLSTLPALAPPARSVIVADPVTSRFLPAGWPPGRVILVKRGEECKDFRRLGNVYRGFMSLGLDRDGIVVGLGGGSVCDLAGFAAATWMRGVGFVLAPTTLLAMTDAAIGGKCGVDLDGRKNMIGAFALPRATLIDPGTLESLPERELSSGIVEAVKHGILDGPEHFALAERAVLPRGSPDRAALPALIAASVRYKAAVVGRDPAERGERRLLNLGHSFGHAIEAATGLAHGQAVAAGLGCALRLGLERGGDERDARRVLELLERLGLPTGIGQAFAAAHPPTKRRHGASPDAAGERAFREEVATLLGSDKKVAGDELLFALPRGIGRVSIESIPLAELREFAGRAP